MKVLRAYNAGSERILSPRLLVIDAARESIKVLKILEEGLGAHARNGIWLVNFQGIPVARPASEFDLIYLDENYRVLQAIEISQDRVFEPFKGNPASALILQPGTIARSRTFTGDRITIEPPENQSIEPEPASSSKPATRLPSQIVTASSAKRFNVPSQRGQDARSTAAAVFGEFMRSGRLEGSIARRANLPVATQSAEISQDTPKGKVVRIAGASAPLPEVERSETSKAPTLPERTPSAPVATLIAGDIPLGAKRTIAPIPRNLTPRSPAPVFAEVPSKIEQPLVAHSFPASKVEPLEPTQPPVPKQTRVEHQTQALAKTDTPSVKREEQWRESSSSGPRLEAGDGLERLSKKIVSWLYPEKKDQPRMRRAPRINGPRLVAYYFAGGPSTPHEIRNISAMGFYMVTDQRWMPGTVIRMTIEPLESDGANSPGGITVFARVVRWGQDGGGFEFVFPGRKD